MWKCPSLSSSSSKFSRIFRPAIVLLLAIDGPISVRYILRVHYIQLFRCSLVFYGLPACPNFHPFHGYAPPIGKSEINHFRTVFTASHSSTGDNNRDDNRDVFFCSVFRVQRPPGLTIAMVIFCFCVDVELFGVLPFSIVVFQVLFCFVSRMFVFRNVIGEVSTICEIL